MSIPVAPRVKSPLLWNKQRIEQGHIDVLTLAGLIPMMQCGHGPQGAVQAGEIVGEEGRRLVGRTLG